MTDIGMKKKEKISAINSVKVIVSPWQKGLLVVLLWIVNLKCPQSNMNYVLL